MLNFKLASFATNAVGDLGYGGVALALFANGVGIPFLPSEIILPLCGSLIRQGQFSWAPVLAVAILAQVAGGITAYWLARKAGIDVVKKYGKYVLFNARDLELTERWFQRYGVWLVLVGSMLPLLKSYVAYPAGVAKLDFRKFVIADSIGLTIWTVGLVVLGYVFSDQLSVIESWLRHFSLVVVLLVALAVVWYVRIQTRRKAK